VNTPEPADRRPDVEITRESIAQGLLEREPWSCPSCVPTLGVQMDRENWTATAAHAVGCDAFKDWLLDVNGSAAPPGTGLGLGHVEVPSLSL
jgi:hypothetical protein